MGPNSTVQKSARTSSGHPAIQSLTEFPSGAFDCLFAINLFLSRQSVTL